MKLSIVIISKDEPKLAQTLAVLEDHLAKSRYVRDTEVLVIDASESRLDAIRRARGWVRWIDFKGPPGVAISIPHQRNAGVNTSQGDVIVFTDSGCVPQPLWLENLLAPIENGEEMVTVGPSFTGDNLYSPERGKLPPTYVKEAPTINMAFRREVFEAVGGFDERFAYGSDTDFTWRLISNGFRIRYVSEAVVDHDWGNWARRMKRSRQYGAARMRLYKKHTSRLRTVLRDDPVPFIYPFWLIGLPLAFRWKGYFLLLLIPLWRARKRPFPIQTVIAHVFEGYGALEELVSIAANRSR
jgi:GT2 family glycosyltransferase